jgi:hypothetical protein
MGMGPLAVRLFSDMNPEQAIDFAKVLRDAANTHRESFAKVAQKEGMSLESLLEDATAKVPDVDWEFRIAKALATFEAAAVWYEKTG